MLAADAAICDCVRQRSNQQSRRSAHRCEIERRATDGCRSSGRHHQGCTWARLDAANRRQWKDRCVDSRPRAALRRGRYPVRRADVCHPLSHESRARLQREQANHPRQLQQVGSFAIARHQSADRCFTRVDAAIPARHAPCYSTASHAVGASWLARCSGKRAFSSAGCKVERTCSGELLRSLKCRPSTHWTRVASRRCSSSVVW